MASPILETLQAHVAALENIEVVLTVGDQEFTLYRQPLSFADALTLSKGNELDAVVFQKAAAEIMVARYVDEDDKPVFDKPDPLMALDADSFLDLLNGLKRDNLEADVKNIEGKSSSS